MKLRSSHPERDQSALYAVESLSSDEKRRFEAHLAGCSACRKAVDGDRDVGAHLGLLAPPAPPRRALRGRLLARAATERPLPAFQFALDDEGAWRELSPGVFRKDLAVGQAAGPDVYLIRVAPGAMVRTHRHGSVEDCYVVAGDLRIAGRHLGAGDHHRAASGTVHENVRSDAGCLALIVAAAA